MNVYFNSVSFCFIPTDPSDTESHWHLDIRWKTNLAIPLFTSVKCLQMCQDSVLHRKDNFST